MKKKNLWIIALVAIITVTFITCDNGNDPPPPDLPKEQTATITGLFDNNATATVQGNFTDTEWNGVPNTIKNTLNSKFQTVGEGSKNNFRNVFARGITIIVEKTTAYAQWKTVGDGVTIYINFAILNDTDTLGNAFVSARNSLISNGAETSDDCNCPVKAHLGIGEICDCGGINCNCTLKVYGELTGNGNNVKIYRSGTVSEADMTAAVGYFNTAYYNSWTEGERNKLSGKVDEIHILKINPNTNGYTYVNIDGKKLFGIFNEYAEYADYYLGEVRDGGITTN